MRLGWVVAGLSWVLLGPPAAASAPPWTSERMIVYSYVAPERQPHVADAVAMVNALLPKQAPTLALRTMPYQPCRGVKRHRGITICPTTHLPGGRAGETRNGQGWARIRVIEQPNPSAPSALYCHELSHAMTDSDEGAWTTMRPCPFDVAAARRVYTKAHR